VRHLGVSRVVPVIALSEIRAVANR
jgi:hypothetical protein